MGIRCGILEVLTPREFAGGAALARTWVVDLSLAFLAD
jgi:hypothetical protein